MMLKEVLKHSRVFHYYRGRNYFASHKDRFEKLLNDEACNRQLVIYSRRGKTDQLSKMIDNIKIQLRQNATFQNWIDVGLYCHNNGLLSDNKAPNYDVLVFSSIDSLKQENASCENPVKRRNIELLNSIERYINRIVSEIESFKPQSDNLEKTKGYFQRMLNCEPESVEEALQRVIFWSSLFWQSGHRLIGLGRLDKLLSHFKIIDREETLSTIEEFLREIHRYYAFKSNEIAMGDTGQIIVLGGIEPNGSYFYNEYTSLFIEATLRCRIPDPKLLLRVSKSMPDSLLSEALLCISTGVGCPLLSNDDVIIEALEQFGYSHADACNYITSACWEPLIYGKSFEVNNLTEINFAKAFHDLCEDSRFPECVLFDEVMNLYIEKLLDNVEAVKKMLSNICWELDPLMTLATEGCAQNGKDITEGGAKYSNYGILTVGLANAVNSLLFIKYHVFDKGDMQLSVLQKLVQTNYEDAEAARQSIDAESNYFGHDIDEALDVISKITDSLEEGMADFKNKLGGGIKWGFSSSGYLERGKSTGATLDGRKTGEPLATHISGSDSLPYTELIRFASRLNYSGQRSNGNVVDFFVSPSLIEDNFEKFLMFLKAAIKLGFFQMQMNVVSSVTLIEAKEHPELFPNLIVRVWGFSAYFNELPDEYKDVLIKRALASEGKQQP